MSIALPHDGAGFCAFQGEKVEILEKFEKKKWRVYVWTNPDGTWLAYSDKKGNKWLAQKHGRDADLVIVPCRFDASMSVDESQYGDGCVYLREEKTNARLMVGKSQVPRLINALSLGFIEGKGGRLTGMWEFQKKGREIVIAPVF